MVLIVGLGNPGAKYAGTRHNIGFDVVDAIARNSAADFQGCDEFDIAFGTIKMHKVALIKPMLFMNRSGVGLRAALSMLGDPPAQIIVIYDDVAIEFGRIRIKTRGGAGGHKGLLSILESLATDSFIRVRIGIKNGGVDDMVDFVLSSFSPLEKKQLEHILTSSIEAVESCLLEGPKAAMNSFNGHDFRDII